MPVIESTITRTVIHPGNRYGIQIAGVWYNGFGKPPADEGDTVHLNYKEVQRDGKTFNNVEECTVLVKASAQPVQSTLQDPPAAAAAAATHEECENRAIALSCAVELINYNFSAPGKLNESMSATIAATLAVARKFERFLNCESEEDILR